MGSVQTIDKLKEMLAQKAKEFGLRGNFPIKMPTPCTDSDVLAYFGRINRRLKMTFPQKFDPTYL